MRNIFEKKEDNKVILTDEDFKLTDYKKLRKKELGWHFSKDKYFIELEYVAQSFELPYNLSIPHQKILLIRKCKLVNKNEPTSTRGERYTFIGYGQSLRYTDTCDWTILQICKWLFKRYMLYRKDLKQYKKDLKNYNNGK